MGGDEFGWLLLRMMRFSSDHISYRSFFLRDQNILIFNAVNKPTTMLMVC